MDLKILKPLKFEGKVYKEGEIVKNVRRPLWEFVRAKQKRTGIKFAILGNPGEFEKKENKTKKKEKQEVNNG